MAAAEQAQQVLQSLVVAPFVVVESRVEIPGVALPAQAVFPEVISSVRAVVVLVLAT